MQAEKIMLAKIQEGKEVHCRYKEIQEGKCQDEDPNASRKDYASKNEQ